MNLMNFEAEELKNATLEQMIWHVVGRSFGNRYRDSLEKLLEQIPTNLNQIHRWIDNAKNELRRAHELSKEAWAKHCEAEYQERLKAHEQLCDAYAKKRVIVEQKLLKVEAWEPPSDEHMWIKQEMMREIELWETSDGDPGPFTQELRLVDARGHTLCTRTFYAPIDVGQKAG